MSERMVTLKVAAGRTVQVANATRMELVGGAYIEVPSGVDKTHYSEGELVTLPESEAERIWKLGFLRKPGEPETRPYGVGMPNGPTLPNMVFEPNAPAYQPGTVRITIQDGGGEAAA